MNKNFDRAALNRKSKLDIINSKYGDLFHYCPLITHYISEISMDLINSVVVVSGRVVNYRNSKLFVFIRDCGIDLQCYCDLKDKNFQDLKLLDIGDYVVFSGKIGVSNTNVLTLFASSFRISSKCLSPVPDQYYVQKYENIYVRKKRTEYLAFYKPAFCAVYLRSKIVFYIRLFFIKNGFYEVETPILQRIAGGALATPFETEYIDKKEIFQLRIAPELYLKRLIIAGFNKIFEISKNFRNEGLSVSHNPEFSMLEVYAVYWRLEDMILLLLHMFSNIISELFKYDTQYLSSDQITFLSTLDVKNIQYYDFFEIIYNNIGKDASHDKLIQVCNDNHIVYENTSEVTFEELCDSYISKIFIKKFSSNSLVCIKNYPVSLSPLAKHSNNSACRFEIYFGGYEIIDGFEENNDYSKQDKIFKQQKEVTNRKYDSDYIEDMKLGFPFTTGAGIGIDRLVCILLMFKNIRDVISYTD